MLSKQVFSIFCFICLLCLNEDTKEQWFLLGVESISEQDLWTLQRNVAMCDLFISCSLVIFLAETLLEDIFQIMADGQWPQDIKWTAVTPFVPLSLSVLFLFLHHHCHTYHRKRHIDSLAICVYGKCCDLPQSLPGTNPFPVPFYATWESFCQRQCWGNSWTGNVNCIRFAKISCQAGLFGFLLLWIALPSLLRTVQLAFFSQRNLPCPNYLVINVQRSFIFCWHNYMYLRGSMGSFDAYIWFDNVLSYCSDYRCSTSYIANFLKSFPLW